MATDAMNYETTFRDFQFLQGYMTRRVFSRNRNKFGPAFLGVALCACLLAAAIFICANPYRIVGLPSLGISYPISFYLVIIVCLLAAILCLMPAVKLRLRTLRMQVSDDGPLLGSTRLTIEPDGLTVDRKMVKSKYLWSAFQGVEIAKGAVILPLDNGIGVIVPASAFKSDADRFEFAAAISKFLEKKMSGST